MAPDTTIRPDRPRYPDYPESDPEGWIDCFVCGARVRVERTRHGLCCIGCAPEARRICDRETQDWSDDMLEWSAAEWEAYGRGERPPARLPDLSVSVSIPEGAATP